MQDRVLKVADPVAALGEAVGYLISAIKDKKGFAEIAAGELPKAIAVAQGFGELGADLKLVDNQVYLLKCILDALEPKPVAQA